MLLDLKPAFGFQCPACGYVEAHRVNLFDFSGAAVISFKCSVCSTLVAAAGRKRGKGIWLRVICFFCEETHCLTVSLKDLFQGRSRRYLCPGTGCHIGAAGSAEEVKELVADFEEEELAPGPTEDFKAFFFNPDVMYQVLNRLHETAKKQDLGCSCGNPGLAVDVYPDRIKLHCSLCNRSLVVWARTEEDATVARTLKVIRLGDKETVNRAGSRSCSRLEVDKKER